MRVIFLKTKRFKLKILYGSVANTFFTIFLEHVTFYSNLLMFIISSHACDSIESFDDDVPLPLPFATTYQKVIRLTSQLVLVAAATDADTPRRAVVQHKKTIIIIQSEK